MAAAPVVALLSGALLAVVGLLLLVARPRRAGSLFFAAFVVLWGANIVAFNLARFVPTADLATVVTRVGLALDFPVTLLLVHFAASFPRGVGRHSRWSMLVATLIVLLGAFFAYDPASFLPGVARLPDGTWVPQTTVVAAVLVQAPFFASFYLAVGLLHHKYTTVESNLERRELGIVEGALLLYVAYVTPFYLVFYVAGWSALVPVLTAPVAASFVLLFAAGALFLAVLAFHVVRRLRRGTAPAQRRSDQALLAAIAVPAAFGLAGAAPIALGEAAFEQIGVFRIASAALIAYGILKHQLFGLDLSLKRFVRGGTPVAAFAGAALLGGAVVRAATSDATLALGAGLALGAVGAALAFPLRHRAADALFPFVTDDDDYLRARAVEVYRAALAQAVARGVDDDAFLRGLRADLGISTRDHDLLRFVVRGEATDTRAVVAARAPVAGRYARERLLGEGGFARVWLAKDDVLDREVVLKELFRPGAAGALAEARAAGALSHPNVVTVFDVVADAERPCVVMEYVDGGSLQDVLDREGTLPRDRALAVTADVLAGLDALHRRGLVHRDVKPGNVLLTKDGRAKVTDFGIAAAAERGVEVRVTVGVAAAPGTLAYMSPEQADGRPLDTRSDLYAVGAMLYRCLAGRFYQDFADQGDYRTRKLIREGAPRLPLKGEPEPVNALLARALEKDPSRRFASAADMLGAVETARGKAATAS